MELGSVLALVLDVATESELEMASELVEGSELESVGG